MLLQLAALPCVSVVSVSLQPAVLVLASMLLSTWLALSSQRRRCRLLLA